jgi:LacI family transcriptional regulator
VELGHRRLAYVRSPRTETSTNAARLRGVRDAVRGAGLKPGPVVTLDPSAATPTVVALEEVLDARDAPTAYLAGNDITALALIDRLEAVGVSVPGQASVVGFDDIALASHARIALTTLRQPIAELAARGVGRLLERVSGDGGDRRRMKARLSPELIERGTTAPPPRRR